MTRIETTMFEYDIQETYEYIKHCLIENKEKFIELTEREGKKFIINTDQIVDVWSEIS